MDRNYPGTGFGDLGAGAGWSYERTAKASLVYGSSRSSHPESELLHRQAYATPHPLQGYATNHHPGSSGQGGAWGAAGRSLGLSGLFDTGLHHASPSAPDASVMNLISALESRGPQPPPSASSLLSQFRTPSWQTAMHTPAPPELFISGALPGSGSFPSSSALSAYQHPASFSSRSFPGASLSLQDTPTFSPTSNGLLSPHDPLIHIKAPSQSSLGFDRLLSSQGAAAAAYRGSQDPTGATSAQASSARHLQSHQFNLLSSQLQDQSSQLYNPSVFPSAQPQPQSQSQSNSAQERAVPRQDSVIKHYQRPTPAQSQLSSSAAHSLQHYLGCSGPGYQQIATHHRHAGLSCSPLGDQSPSSDHKPTSRTEQYRSINQPPYSSSSSSSSSSSAGKGTKSSSSSGYSSGSSASSSRTPHTPPSASSTSSSSSSSSATSGAHPSNSIPTSTSSAAPSRQQPPPQPAPPPPAPQQQPPATSTSAPQSLPKSCLSGYGSPVPPVKTPTSALTGQTPPQQQTQSYSPNQPPTSHLAQSYGGFSSPQAQDLSSGTGGKGYGSLGGRSQSYSTDLYGTDSAYGSLPSSLGGAGSPSLGYGAPGHSPALLRSSGSSGSGASGGGSSSGTGSGNSGSGGGAGNGLTNERGGGGSGGASYHIPDSSPSPSGNSGIIRPGLHSPVPNCPTQSPGGPGSNKYISSVLSPTFLASPQGFPDTRGPSSQPQSYHSTSSKTKADTSMLGVGSQRSQEEVDDDDEFLIQHLLQAQASPAPQAAHHHPQQQPQQTSQQTQPQPQSVPPTTDSGKGMSYDMSKTPEERYHPQSVIRTHSATTTAGVGNAGSGGSISGLDSQLEMSLKKQQQQHQQHHHQQQQQQRNERSVGSSRSSGGRGSAEQVHSHLHHHDNLGSVVHYGRGDPYTQHSLAPQHSSHTQHVSSHSQIPPHTQMELQKKPQERAEIPYPRKTPEIQQQHSQSQAAASLMDSPTDQSRQPPHLLQSVLSHTTRNKMEPHPQHHKMDSHRQHQQHHKMDSHPQHQQHQKMDSHQHQQHHKIDSHSQHQQHHKMDSLPQQQQHSISQQQAVMDNTGGRLGSSKHQPQSQSQATQLQLQLQSQALEVAAAHYNHGPPPHQHEQSQVKQSSVVSSLDMLERSLSQTSSTDVAVAEDRRGGPGSAGRSGASGERHRQQQQEQQRQHAPHHQPPQTHHSQQHSASELHSFLTEPDIGLSTPSHMHHLSQHHAQQQQHPSSQHQQTHSHHPHTQPHPQQPPHPHHIPPPSASALSQPQPDPQQPLSAQLTPQQSQLDQQRSEQHQFDTVSPVEKADQNQQSNRFVPLTSICFPDSLLQDEDRSFFPGMEDMFCAEDYKSSCAGGAGPGQEEMNESHTGQEGMDALKAGQSAGGAGGSSGPSYDIMGHHGGDQGYEPYCHGLDEPTNNTMTLDLDSLKTHELPSTVNTEQLGLIQSQAPAMGMTSNTAGPNNSGAKMSSGPGGTNAGPGSGGLQSPIFCSSRPKKLLKSSSFHLLKERRDPNTLPKKSYAQEYEFEDDEDKADQPADIRLNSRRLPDLLPDLVSSCRKGGGGSGSLSPLMGDIDFYHSSGYSTMGSHTLLPPEGPKKRGRKPTRPKREGPPRPRGRPRIRPMPEPYTPRGMMGEMGGMTVGGGFSVEGRGRGRGRGSRGRGGRREDMYIEMSGKEPDQMHHHHLHQQQQPPQQLHHQPQQQQQQQHEPIPPLKIKLPIGTLSSSDALLRTDSLSGTDPALSDGSVGSAPSLGLSPGPPCSTESTRSQDKIKQKSQMMGEGVDDEGLEERGDEKDSESKAGFVASFLDFLKTGKRHPGLDISPGMEPDNGETSPCKSGGLRSLSPAPPPPPPPPPFGDGEGNGGLALGNCPSPKRLEDELKRNLETLPSFSSDEEDSVGKNQDLQKSISSAISALYDTPQLTSNIQPPLPPPQSQNQPSQGPLTPTMQPPTLSPQPAMHTPHTQPQSNEPDVLQPEDVDMNENKEEEEEEEEEENEEERSTGGDEESDMTEEPQLETLGAPKLDAPLPEIPPEPTTPEPPSVPPSPASSSSPSHSPLPPLSLPSPLPPAEEQQEQEDSQPPSPVAPTPPSPPPAPPTLATIPQPATPPPPPPPASAPTPAPVSPPPSVAQKESPMPSPESPASPEEPPAPKITSLHLAQKQEDAAIVGESEEDESESGGEGIFRERDEFVVRVEDIRTLKLALQTGREPPPIWRVQKALLQKFSPEIKDGQRQFCATSNYLGYFGDAKRRYQRIYVKFLENVNKKDYVRVCSRRPWRRATPALRRQSLPRMASPPATQVPSRVVEKEERVAPPVQREQKEKTRTATTTTTTTTKEPRERKELSAAVPKAEEKEKNRDAEKEREREKRVQPQQEKAEKRAAERGRTKEDRKVVERKEKEKAERPPKSKPAKVKAEPPPKKRKKWLKEVPSSSDSDSSDEAASENEMPVKGGVNNRAMREMFRSYVEMLVSTALDPDMIQALEDTDDELYLPPMRKIDSILSEQKRRLLRRVSMSSQHQEVLHAYPQIIVDPLDSGVVRVRLSGDAYNRKTLNRVKKTLPKPQDLKLSAESYRIYSLYHSLHHYKYHTFLQCKKETNTIEQAAEDPGQEEVVQQCMANQNWLDSLFSSFIELLTLSTKA
ncbi:LOW QUALITY PROTEIN: proline-rich protein 12-like [Simochromis diagramma]|uniref:LOW QUALITY PROTEIN: proline-rich protein 12-like n=1 Tax=Simochromis diagramma TaxID=43689 RepID=UPI001A7EFA96|nr:LOW QUALITY PROTEIN: proline-rich protein 12-like [Simochromis diagramma]